MRRRLEVTPQARRDFIPLLLIKTRADRQAAIEARIRALHLYEMPEIISTPITFGATAYLKWIDEALGGEEA